MDRIERIIVSAGAAAILLVASGCATGQATPSAQQGQTQTVPQSQAMQPAPASSGTIERHTDFKSEDKTCSGAATLDIPQAWTYDGKSFTQNGSSTDSTTMAVYCSARSRYTKVSSWDIGSLTSFMFAKPIADGAQVRDITLDGHPATELAYSANGKDWIEVQTIVGDKAVFIEASSDSTKPPSGTFRDATVHALEGARLKFT